VKEDLSMMQEANMVYWLVVWNIFSIYWE
jgi:hypothetical protein